MVELFLVIAVIGALLTITLISVTASENTAKANTIISNMLNMRMLYQALLVKNPAVFRDPTDNQEISIGGLTAFIDVPKIADRDKYAFVYSGGENSKGWWVRYTMEGDSHELKSELQEIVDTRTELALLGYDGDINSANDSSITTKKYLIMKAY